MAKATKTAKELEAKIMRAAKASGKCRDLLSVTVLPAGILSSNWKIGTASSNQDNHLLSGECRIELDKIVARLKLAILALILFGLVYVIVSKTVIALEFAQAPLMLSERQFNGTLEASPYFSNATDASNAARFRSVC